jgi:hypothetical protein
MCVVFMFELLQNEYWLYGCDGELWYARQLLLVIIYRCIIMPLCSFHQ